jgi:hypothetical protein
MRLRGPALFTLNLAAANARGALAVAALTAISVGLWWERPSLALILPGGFILWALVWSHTRSEPEC